VITLETGNVAGQLVARLSRFAMLAAFSMCTLSAQGRPADLKAAA
jgi:hypothetical protein